MVDKLTYYDLKENVKTYVRNRNGFVKIIKQNVNIKISHMYNILIVVFGHLFKIIDILIIFFCTSFCFCF